MLASSWLGDTLGGYAYVAELNRWCIKQVRSWMTMGVATCDSKEMGNDCGYPCCILFSIGGCLVALLLLCDAHIGELTRIWFNISITLLSALHPPSVVSIGFCPPFICCLF